MKRIIIDMSKIDSWKSFHNSFSELLNFPDYYGENMDAWIDFMDDLVEEFTVLELRNCQLINEGYSEYIGVILECSAFINARKLERNETPVLLVSVS